MAHSPLPGALGSGSPCQNVVMTLTVSRPSMRMTTTIRSLGSSQRTPCREFRSDIRRWCREGFGVFWLWKYIRKLRRDALSMGTVMPRRSIRYCAWGPITILRNTLLVPLSTSRSYTLDASGLDSSFPCSTLSVSVSRSRGSRTSSWMRWTTWQGPPGNPIGDGWPISLLLGQVAVCHPVCKGLPTASTSPER